MSKQIIEVFTDGSCFGNGSKYARGGIGVHFPNKELKDLSLPYEGDFCTNQKTELYAILTAIRYIKKYFKLSKLEIIIKTDSNYSINCITKWVEGWIKNGWITTNNKPVSNRNYIERIYNYYRKYDIEFVHVHAHTGNDDYDSICNAVADKLATDATRKLDSKKKTSTKSKSKSGSKSSIKSNIPLKKSRTQSTISRSPNRSSDKSRSSSEKPRIKLSPKNQDVYLKTGKFFVELVKK